MTTDQQRDPGHDPGEQYERVVSSGIRARVSARNTDRQALADALGLSLESVNRRLRDQSPWTLADLARAAPVFGVEPADLARPVTL